MCFIVALTIYPACDDNLGSMRNNNLLRNMMNHFARNVAVKCGGKKKKKKRNSGASQSFRSSSVCPVALKNSAIELTTLTSGLHETR